jgi:hypothetical protein
VKQCCIEVKEAVVDLKEEIKTTIHAAIDEKVEADGGINAAILDKSMSAMENRIMSRLDKLAVGGIEHVTHAPRVEVNHIDAGTAPICALDNQFWYKSRAWCVPEEFEFPTEVTRMDG